MSISFLVIFCSLLFRFPQGNKRLNRCVALVWDLVLPQNLWHQIRHLVLFATKRAVFRLIVSGTIAAMVFVYAGIWFLGIYLAEGRAKNCACFGTGFRTNFFIGAGSGARIV